MAFCIFLILEWIFKFHVLCCEKVYLKLRNKVMNKFQYKLFVGMNCVLKFLFII